MFKVKVVKLQDWVVVELHGDLDQSGIDAFKGEIEKLIKAPVENYLFDLGSLKFISSEGLNVLLWFRFQLGKQGDVRVVLSNASAFLEKILNITKIDSHFEIVPDRGEFFHSLGFDFDA